MGLGAWEEQPGRLGICIPHVGIAPVYWAVGFKTLQIPIPYSIFANQGLPIDRSRENLAEQALKEGCEWIFFLDSDVVLPPNALQTLFGHAYPFISALYGSKHGTTAVWRKIREHGNEKYVAVPLHELASKPIFTEPNIVIGLGASLIHRSVFDKLKRPWFKWTQGLEDGGVSEDFYFCEKCNNAGIAIYVRTDVKCKHLGLVSYNEKGALEKI